MNNSISNIHLDILDDSRKTLLKQLLPYTTEFILAGGTALAFHLSHRKSYDFDFFSSSPILKRTLETLSKTIKIKTISVDTSDELTFFTHNGIKVTLLHYYFDHRYPIQEASNRLRLFSIKDIAIQKAYTIGRRGEYRDYFDLYTVLNGGYGDIKVVTSDAKKLYPGVFDEKQFLQQLVYFDDLLNFDIVPANQEALPHPQDLKRYFEEQVKKYI